MSESVYFFDDYQQLIKIVSEPNILESVQEKEITTNKGELINNTLKVTLKYDDDIKEAAFMAVREQKEQYAMFRIAKISDPEDQLMFTGADFAPGELDGYIVKDIRPKNEEIGSVVKRILEDTEWTVGYVQSGIKNINSTFYYISVRDALKQLQTFDCEITFSCKLNADGIESKKVNIYKQIGEESQKRYTYGDKALTVVKELDRSQVYTSIIGRGKGEEVGDGYGRRLEFTDIEWKKSSGAPLDKPKGQNWLEFPEMTKQYGIPLKDGNMRKREKVVVFDDEEDAEALLNKTYAELIECSRPLVQFKTTLTEGDAIGNTITIHRFDRNYHYNTRVFKTTLNRLTGVTEASVGDNLTSNMSRKTAQITNGITTLNESKMNFYSSEEISKWQSDIIRGAKGGSVIMMNPEDTGKGTSREPYQTVWMNGADIESSDHFLVANSEGIGFIDGKFDESKFKTAWTIDGVFNANYIQAGVLSGILIKGCTIQTISDVLSSMIQMSNGKIDFINTVNKKSYGAIQPILSSNGDGISISTPVGGTIQLGMESTATSGGVPVIQIPPESTNDNPVLQTWAKWTHKGELHVDRLYVNGKEITGNGSGEGGDGTPPELTTDQEKNAWAVWSYFKVRGWTEEAIAGMLGNMQSESGIMPDIDEIGGGGGYGLVQWTPKSKLVDWCNERGLDYRTIDSQCQRIQWEMENNVQWFPNPERPDLPNISFREFTQLKDIKRAAEYFIAFYEHPANVNQPIRGTQAQYWYDRLHGLTGGGNWMNPVHSSYVVTQEWDQIGAGTSVIHGGIDLASMPPGTKPPIYAAKAGTVIVTGSNPSLEGNYLMIDHLDGYYTYYGHFDSISVKQGDKVTTSSILGIMGATGLAKGVHLHFEVRKGGQSSSFRINPRDVIDF
ncbi:peptidoglycan DD-metalloendopeptidase family protein [Erwinia sp. CPCC 100877]|nr:peptidoglycan DD-metalloendopeptidase family protein [Erwinia sp. CPCC 100877]